MPFFLKTCIRLRKKKKKAVKKNSSTYFKPYLDKESPVASEAIHEDASNSFVSIDRDERDLGLPPILILDSSELQVENTEAKESGNTKNITGVPSPDRDIFDILSSAVQLLSEEKSSSDDNRYSILSSSSRLDEETGNTDMKNLLNESFENSDDKLNEAKEQQPLDSFTEECVKDSIEDKSDFQDFIIGSRLSKDMLLKEISREGSEGWTDVIKILPIEVFCVNVVKFVSKHHQITERKSLLPVTIQECSVERKVISVRNESAVISECKYKEENFFESISNIEPSILNLIESPIKPLVPLTNQEFSDDRTLQSVINESAEINEYKSEEACIENILTIDLSTLNLISSPMTPIVPLTIQECSAEQTIPSVRNESSDINECKCEEEVCIEKVSTIYPSKLNLLTSSMKPLMPLFIKEGSVERTFTSVRNESVEISEYKCKDETYVEKLLTIDPPTLNLIPSQMKPSVPLIIQECFGELAGPPARNGSAEISEYKSEEKACFGDVSTIHPSIFNLIPSSMKPLLPLTIQECSAEQAAPSFRNKSVEISDCFCEEEVCVDFENVSTIAIPNSKINLIPSPEQIHWKSESYLGIQEVSPITDTSDKQEEKHAPECNNFFDLELPLAVNNALCVNFCESDHENATEGFTGDVTRELFYSSNFLEITGSSSQWAEKEMVNPAESINLSYGDNASEIFKIENNNNINVPLKGTVYNETLEASKIIHEFGSSVLSECSGDHPANITNTLQKGLTCRMAAKLMNDLPSNVSSNQMNVNMQRGSRTEQRNTISKRRRSRNVLLNSLKSKLSPDDLKKETKIADQQGSNEKSEQKHANNSNEKNNPCDDADTPQTLENQCNKIDREDTVGNAFIYEINPYKAIGNHTDYCNNVTSGTKIGNLHNKNIPSLIESAVKNNFPNEKVEDSNYDYKTENLEKYRITYKNDSLPTEKASNLFEPTAEMQMRVNQVIKKILSFVQREVSLLHQNKEYEPKGFKYFIKELLFDYNFSDEQKNRNLLNNQKSTKNSVENTNEPNETKSANNKDEGLGTCEFNNTAIEISENYGLSPNKNNISFEDIKSFRVNFNSTGCESEIFLMDFKNAYGIETIKRDDEDRILMTSEIKTNDEEIFDDLKLSQSLDEYLKLADHLKCKNQSRKSKNVLTPISHDTESKSPPHGNNSETLHTINENMCSQMTSNYAAAVGSLNKLKSFSFDNVNFFVDAEKHNILEYPNFTSEGSDNSKNDLFIKTSTSSGDTCIKLNLSDDDIKSETVGTSDITIKTQMSKLDSDKCTISRQNPQNHVTIVLSPRNNNATVNCNVNMAISGNAPTCTTRSTSPTSIQVTREGNNIRESCSFRTRDISSKSSDEDITEIFRRHRTHKFDVKKLERERLRNLELYDLNKREAMKPMRKQTRIIPVQPAESFEFTFRSLDKSFKYKKLSTKHSAKSAKQDVRKFQVPYQIRSKDAKSGSNDVNKYTSSKISTAPESNITKERIPTNQAFYKRHDSINSTVYGTPIRRRILTASKAIRSPKYSLKAETSPLKEIRHHKVSPHKIIVNNPKLYFLDESSPEYKRENNGRSRILENTKYFEDRQRPLNSPFSDYRQHYLCTKLDSLTDLNSKFDDKFKRYARRGRNTGDLISYKRSTQWLRDAGIIGQVLTADEADRAFKSAAGVKVALNKFDYRRFLYKLARLKRLRYSEIYEKLCEAVNELA